MNSNPNSPKKNSNPNSPNKNKKPNSPNKNKKPSNPKTIKQNKYFKIGIRDSARVRIIKEGMNHLCDLRNSELEEAFLQEATQYTERVLGETRRFHFTEEEDHEAMDVIFNNSMEEVAGAGLNEEEELEEQELEEELQEEELEEEELEEELKEPEEESETLSSEEVLALQERIQAEDQEEYERIRAEMEEDEANKDN